MSQPHSEDMERALLGSIILDSDRVLFICSDEGVSAAWFYNPWHATLFNALVAMQRAARPVSLMTVGDYLKRENLTEETGGETYFERLIDATPTAAHAEYYIQELREFYTRRTIYDIAREAAQHAKAGDKPASETLSDILRAVVGMTSRNSRVTPDTIAKKIEEQWRNALAGVVTGIMTPWPKVNKLLGGAQPREVTIIAGRGGTGKSSLLANWVGYLGAQNVPVGYIPFEDGVDRTTKRLAGIYGQFSVFNADRGLLPKSEVETAVQFVRQIVKRPVYMEDRPMTSAQIMAWGMSMKARHNIQAIFIDAFKDVLRERQDVEADNKLSGDITVIARRLEIPAIICHHIRKGSVSDTGFKRLTDEDLRGSGRIKDDARQVLVLQCENMGSAKEPDLHFDLDVVKTNNGPTGSVPMERVSRYYTWLEK